MWLRRCALGVLVGGVTLLATSLAHAQCSKDTDCKGDRVCEAGSCVSSAATPAASPAAAPAGQATPTNHPAAPVADATTSNTTPVPPADLSPAPPKMQRHSKGMMVGGIVMVSFAPVALLVAGTAALGRGLCGIGTTDATGGSPRSCSGYDPFIYGGLLSALALAGVGVPLIVVGATKEPVDPSGLNASISPWATQTSAGLSLQLTL